MNNEHEETEDQDLREGGDNFGGDYYREDEGPRYLQVNAKEYPIPHFRRDELDHPRDDPYDLVRVRIRKPAHKETVLHMLRSLSDWFELNGGQLYKDKELLNSSNGKWHECTVVVLESGHEEATVDMPVTVSTYEDHYASAKSDDIEYTSLCDGCVEEHDVTYLSTLAAGEAGCCDDCGRPNRGEEEEDY